jgi:hypothetical protein
MDSDQEAISRSLNNWGYWLRNRLPPFALFLLGVAFGRWVSSKVLVMVVFGWLFLIVLSQLLGSPAKQPEDRD